MKKKVLLLSLALTLLLTGVVSAASIWGKYKGYDIMRITVDGQALKTDVPAFVFDNRTMVPVYLLKEAGISYSLDSKNQTVDIKKSTKSGNSEVEKIKSYARLADYYDILDELGGSIANIAQQFEIVYNHYTVGTDPGVSIDDAFDTFNNQVKRKNDRMSIVDMAKFEGDKVGVDTSDVQLLMNNYYDALEYFRKSLVALEEIVEYGYTQQRYNEYFDNASKGLDISNHSSLSAYKQYVKYIGEATK